MNVKLHCYLLSGSELLVTVMIYRQMYTYQANQGTSPEATRVTGGRMSYK